MKYSSDKELNKEVRKLVLIGSVFWRGGKHGRLRLPTGAVVTVPSTPSSPYVVKNFIGTVKRAMANRMSG